MINRPAFLRGAIAALALALIATPALAAPKAKAKADPVTHVQIINACTSAQRLDKKPVLPLLRPDGTLPILP